LRRLLLATALAALLAGCHPSARRPVLSPGAHYVVGRPYQAQGLWRYPREQFDSEETGLAAIYRPTARVTEDGELADASAMAAAHPTLQLPAVARVTNLDNGLQVVVRLNDRGPMQPGRVAAVTPRVAKLLGAGGQGPFRIRLQVLDSESRRLAADLTNDAASLPVAAAPTKPVSAEPLGPPPGARQAGLVRAAAPSVRPQTTPLPAVDAVPLRLPEMVTRVPPRAGALYVEAGTFGELQFADILRVRLAVLGAQTSTSYDAPRERAYRVRIGPLSSVAAADAVLGRTIQAGIADARIVAE
jgi:rare lipoprotein A